MEGNNLIGSGGNGYAWNISNPLQHPLAVKLGNDCCKADGLEADIYCYSCDDLVLDPELNAHLSAIGSDANALAKLKKSAAELNLDINLTRTSYADDRFIRK